MPAATPFLPLLLALLPSAAALTALPLRRLPPPAIRLLGAAAAGMQIGVALFLLLLPALAAAAALPVPIWLPTCGGVLLGAALSLFAATHDTAAPSSHPLRQFPPLLALGALAALSAASPALPLFAAAAAISCQSLAENLPPQMPGAYAGFMHTLAAVLPGSAALLIAYACATLLPLLQVLLPALGAGAMLCRAIAETVPQLQQSYRANICTLCISLGFALMLFCYAFSR
ncbi:MAG: hypothetical protein IKC76_03465 [Firmicutes bacterium]|nr:hypothetical protein [Bacillota bacterium]